MHKERKISENKSRRDAQATNIVWKSVKYMRKKEKFNFGTN